jgi:hypothetical protein
MNKENLPMNHRVTFIVTSVLAALLAAFHVTDDIVRGFEGGGPSNMTMVFILVVWLYAALVLSERRLGYVIVLVMSILGSGVPVIHMRGAGMVGGRIANSSGKFFWVWTLLALGTTTILSAILAAHGLWRLHRAQARRN